MKIRYTRQSIIALLFFIAGCGFNVHIDPVEVDHKVTFTDLTVYFRSKCLQELGTHASDDTIDLCVQNKVDDFIDTIGNG